MPLRHGLSRVPAFASIALRQPPAAALPIPRMLRPGKSIHGFSGDCRSALHFCMRKAALRGSLLVASKRQKSIHGFFRDCRIATHFCMRKAALRGSLLIGKYERKNPSMDFLGIAEARCTSACAKSPSMALYWWQVRGKNPSVDFLGFWAVQ